MRLVREGSAYKTNDSGEKWWERKEKVDGLFGERKGQGERKTTNAWLSREH